MDYEFYESGLPLYDVWEYPDSAMERDEELVDAVMENYLASGTEYGDDKMIVYIAVVANNPGLSNAFNNREDAVKWIEGYLDSPTMLGSCWYISGDLKAWLVSREVSL